MTTVGVFNVIIQDNKVLLVKRRDLPLWDLPGGSLEIGESIEEGLVRETMEETGLIVSNYKQIAHFTNTSINDEQYIFTSSVSGGQLISEGPETKAIKYFSINALPKLLIPHRKAQIKSMNNVGPIKIVSVKDSWFISFCRKLM